MNWLSFEDNVIPNEKEISANPTYSHANEVAHRLAAEAIYQFLMAENLLKITP